MSSFDAWEGLPADIDFTNGFGMLLLLAASSGDG